jgi:hypothetical protein
MNPIKLISIMKNYRIIYIAVFANMVMLMTSCGLGPCDCAEAEFRNDTKTIQKCNEKTSKMTQSEREKWYKKEAECYKK